MKIKKIKSNCKDSNKSLTILWLAGHSDGAEDEEVVRGQKEGGNGRGRKGYHTFKGIYSFKTFFGSWSQLHNQSIAASTNCGWGLNLHVLECVYAARWLSYEFINSSFLSPIQMLSVTAQRTLPVLFPILVSSFITFCIRSPSSVSHFTPLLSYSWQKYSHVFRKLSEPHA